MKSGHLGARSRPLPDTVRAMQKGPNATAAQRKAPVDGVTGQASVDAQGTVLPTIKALKGVI